MAQKGDDVLDRPLIRGIVFAVRLEVDRADKRVEIAQVCFFQYKKVAFHDVMESRVHERGPIPYNGCDGMSPADCLGCDEFAGFAIGADDADLHDKTSRVDFLVMWENGCNPEPRFHKAGRDACWDIPAHSCCGICLFRHIPIVGGLVQSQCLFDPHVPALFDQIRNFGNRTRSDDEFREVLNNGCFDIIHDLGVILRFRGN